MIFESFFGVFASDDISLQNGQHDEGVSIRKQLRDLRRSGVLGKTSIMEFKTKKTELTSKMNNFYKSILGDADINDTHHQFNPESLLEMSNQLDREYNELCKDIELEEQNLAAIQKKIDSNRVWLIALNTQISIIKHLNDKSTHLHDESKLLHDEFINDNKKKLIDINKMVNATQEHINEIKSHIQSIKKEMEKYKMIQQNEQVIDEKTIADKYKLFFFTDIVMVPMWSVYEHTLTNIQYIIYMIKEYNQEYTGIGAKIDNLVTKLFADYYYEGNEPTDTCRDYLKNVLGGLKAGIETLKNYGDSSTQ